MENASDDAATLGVDAYASSSASLNGCKLNIFFTDSNKVKKSCRNSNGIGVACTCQVHSLNFTIDQHSVLKPRVAVNKSCHMKLR